MTYAAVEFIPSFLFNNYLLCDHCGTRPYSGAGDTAVNEANKSPALKISGLGATSGLLEAEHNRPGESRLFQCGGHIEFPSGFRFCHHPGPTCPTLTQAQCYPKSVTMGLIVLVPREGVQ